MMTTLMKFNTERAVREAMTEKRPLAAHKTQVNWRFRSDLLEKAKAESASMGFRTVTAFLEYLLIGRYYKKQ